MKSKEELNALKEEVEALNKKLAELNEEELRQVTGGKFAAAIMVGIGTQFPFGGTFTDPSDNSQFNPHIYTPDTKEEAERKFFGNK